MPAIAEAQRSVSRHRTECVDVEEVRHGTTVASNAILELRGQNGLITTQGFRCSKLNLRMPRLYDLTWNKPPMLVERYLRMVVDERISAQGEIEAPGPARRSR